MPTTWNQIFFFHSKILGGLIVLKIKPFTYNHPPTNLPDHQNVCNGRGILNPYIRSPTYVPFLNSTIHLNRTFFSKLLEVDLGPFYFYTRAWLLFLLQAFESRRLVNRRFTLSPTSLLTYSGFRSRFNILQYFFATFKSTADLNKTVQLVVELVVVTTFHLTHFG